MSIYNDIYIFPKNTLHIDDKFELEDATLPVVP